MVDAQTETVLFETPLLEHRRAQRTGASIMIKNAA